MSELVNYDVIEGTFERYFEEHDSKFQALFDSFEYLTGIVECRFVVFPEKIYNQFPAIVKFMSTGGRRVFEGDLPDAVNAALKNISYLPNVAEFEDVDPEAIDVELENGQIISVFLSVLEVLKIFLAPYISKKIREMITIGLHDQEPDPISPSP